jgi:serine protease
MPGSRVLEEDVPNARIRSPKIIGSAAVILLVAAAVRTKKPAPRPTPTTCATTPRRPLRRALTFVFAFAVGLASSAAIVRTHHLLVANTHANSSLMPDDPGDSGQREGWTRLQWNFAGPAGVGAPRAWANLEAAGAPGGEGVTVAVLDTGVAYPGNKQARPASPDLSASRFVPGYDFVDDDDDPYDENGHGTHVASTIAEETDNGYGVTGLAYRVRVMPVRVLDRDGDGDAATVARGVRYATDNGAKVINLSFNFAPHVSEHQIPELIDAMRYAHEQGTVVVAGAGNASIRRVTYPARDADVVAVGATTEHGCLASYSNYGPRVDLVAPGGGSDANIANDRACRPGRRGTPIYQVTLAERSRTHFELTGYIGTSMAAPHVAATAALVVASGVIGENPSPAAIEAQLKHSARDLGRPGPDALYASGLVDAAAATTQQP